MSEFQEVPGRSVCSPCWLEYTKFEAQVTKNALLPSWLFECTCQVTPPPIGLATLSPSCLQRERFSAAVGQNEERKGETPARGRCAAKRNLPPTLLARSSGQEDVV